VAFESWASNLVPTDINKAPDVFVHDRITSVTERVSVGFDGAEGNGYAFDPSVSADGRYVAFYSLASNLVPGDTGTSDVFVHDRVTDATERVSSAPGGSQGNGGSSSPSVSADGRYFAFVSEASDLVPGDANGVGDVFVHDRGPAIGVGELAIASEATRISVSGWSTFSGLVVASAPDDPNDGSVGAERAGAELTGAGLTYRPQHEDLLVSLRMESLPGVVVERCARTPTFPPATVCADEGTGAGAPGGIYGLVFEVDDSRYEIRATRAGGTPPAADPYFALYTCEDVCLETTPLTGGLGTTGDEVLVSVPLDSLGAEEGAAVTDIEAWTALGDATVGAVVRIDEAELPAATISTPRVELGVAPISTPEEDVVYTTEADLVDGRFSATLDISALAAGDYLLWARGCLATTCGARSVGFTVAGDLIETSLGLELERVRGDSVATATLTETDSGIAIGGAQISFFVNGALVGDAITDATGRAQITLHRSQFKTRDVLRAVFAGDERYGASSAE
jgi:hypothetical protein